MEEEEIIRILSLLHKGVVPVLKRGEYAEVLEYVEFYLYGSEDGDEYECWDEALRCLHRSYPN